jgi:hypothetical protein
MTDAFLMGISQLGGSAESEKVISCFVEIELLARKKNPHPSPTIAQQLFLTEYCSCRLIAIWLRYACAVRSLIELDCWLIELFGGASWFVGWQSRASFHLIARL